MAIKNIKRKIILAVFAHADDAEYGAAGSIARWASEGARVFYLVCTNGNKGSSDPRMTSKKLAVIRKKEQRAAARILGVKNVFFLPYNDTELEPTSDLKEKIVKVIRRVKPDTVITFDPKMRYSVVGRFVNHPDHVAVGEATLSAVYPLARDRLNFPNHARLGLTPHKTKEILLMNRDEANFFVDITKTINKKLRALACHQSQFENFAEAERGIRQWTSKLGKKINAKYAEGFKRIIL